MTKIFNSLGRGSEELRAVTGSFYANADFGKIEGIVAAVEHELSRQIGADVFDAIAAKYKEGKPDATVAAAQRVVGYMATLRYFRLNDISHETDGRKVKMDADNERRPFEWQLERDDRMHLEEYYSAFDHLVLLLMDDEKFRSGELYGRIKKLCIRDCGTLEWVTGIASSPHLYLRMVPVIYEAQTYVEKRLGSPVLEIEDERLLYLARAATGLRAFALFVQKTEMKALPGGAFREAVSGGGKSESSTTSQLHDFHEHMLALSFDNIHDMQHRRDEISGGDDASHLIMPDNDFRNKFFRF